MQITHTACEFEGGNGLNATIPAPLNDIKWEENLALRTVISRMLGKTEGAMMYAETVIERTRAEAAHLSEMSATAEDERTRWYLRGMATRAETAATQLEIMARGFADIKQVTNQLGGHGHL